MKTLLSCLLISLSFGLFAQQKMVPAQVNLKDGTSINVKHFGQLKCGKNTYGDNYIYIKGKYQGTFTEVQDFKNIQKIVLEGYKAGPVASVGNEKATIRVFKKSGASFNLDNAEIYMNCYGTGDKYNVIVMQIVNPINDQVSETKIATKDIQSIIFN